MLTQDEQALVERARGEMPIGIEVNNREFLLAVAGGGANVWVCSFSGSPAGPDARWAGQPHTVGDQLDLPPTHNTYYSVAALRPGGGRRRAAFERMIVLVADDADPAALKHPPSYILRTSTGKRQIGYILLDTPQSRDEATCKRAVEALVANRLVAKDTSGNNTVRYVRLPVGSNTKYDDRPAHVLEAWNPDLRYSLDEALLAFGVLIGATAPAAEREAPAGAAAPAVEWYDAVPVRLDVDAAAAAILDGSVLNNSLLRLAAHHAAKGLTAATIVQLLRDLMDRSAAKDHADRATRWQVRRDQIPDMVRTAVEKFGSSYAGKVDFTEMGNANLLAQKTNGDLRYVVGEDRWLAWAGGRWEADVTGAEVFKAASLIGEHYAREAARLRAELTGMDGSQAKAHRKTIDVVESWEKTCRSRRAVENMLAFAKKHPAFVIHAAQLDTNPHLLGVQNGVVDLRTGELKPDAREDFVTRRCAYAYRPEAKADRWRAFIDEVTGYPITAEHDAQTGEVLNHSVDRFRPRPGYAGYLQRALGYSATGLTVEHKMFTVFGEQGSNGKNVLFDTVRAVLGGYATTASEKLLLTTRRETDANSTTPALMALKGARLAVSSEPPASSTFDSSVLKALTGETRVAGRGMYADAGEIAVTWHIWLLCNAKPKVQHLEGALVSRILMLPFDRQWNRPGVAERDPALPDADTALAAALLAEGDGILAWLVEGARGYFAEGLEPCVEVVDATRSYFKDQRVDPVEQWLAEQQRCPVEMGTQARVLFQAFTRWRVARETAGSLRGGESPQTEMAFSKKLKAHGVDKATHGVVRYGLRLVDEFERQPDEAEHEQWLHSIA